MAYVYQNIIIGDLIDVGPTGGIMSKAKGYLITGNDTQSVVLPVGLDGQVLTADSTAAEGLSWQNTADLVEAGLGLFFTGNVLNVGGSATILPLADTVAVNSNGVLGQPLLSAGTVDTPAVYGPLNLAGTGTVTGSLGVPNGGTGSTAFAPDSVIISNGDGSALIASDIDPTVLPNLYAVTTTDATPTNIHTIPAVANTAYAVTVNFLGKSSTETANFRVRATLSADGAATVTLIGTDLAYVPLGTTWEGQVLAAGNTIAFQVTGAAATTINWVATIEVLTVVTA